MRAALYIRVSTDEQARAGLSLPEQRRNLEAAAKEKNYKVVGVYEDAGISARKPYTKRPALLRLLDDCKAGLVDVILFVKLDRWFRNVANYYAVQEILDSCKVSWEATLEDYETVTASGRFKVNIMLSVAQDEADRTSERIKFVFDGKKALGQTTNGRAPIGYSIKNGEFYVTENGAEMVADMFAEFIRLKSTVQLAVYMRNTWGIDRHFSKYISYLKNRKYIGEVYGVENACPALVSKEDFILANEILEQRSQRHSNQPDRIYLFSGLIYCKECGKTMNTSCCKGKYIYYRCRTRMLEKTACPHVHRVPEEKLESYLLSELETIATRYNASAYPAAKKKTAISPDKIRAKMQRLKDLYVNGLIDLAEYREDRSELDRQLALAESISDDEKPKSVEDIKAGIADYPNLTRSGKKEFWTRTIRRIDADDSGAFFVLPR